MSDFTHRPEVYQVIRETKSLCGHKRYSDIIDSDGNQYVDLVMEGGGVLGIAVVGYTFMMEEMGIRFLGVGGTSAGSINALLVAALGTPAERKSRKIVDLLSDLDLYEFVDGNRRVRRFIDSFVGGASRFRLVTQAACVWPTLRRNLGLNPGDAFYRWLSGVLENDGVRSLADLNNRINTLPPGLKTRDGQLLSKDDVSAYLALVAADITTQTKVEFPKMAHLYWENPDEVNPAWFVRASMSIPGFFYPLRITDMPSGPDAWDNWNRLASYSQGIPSESLLVDGGIMSNFPIDLFHSPMKIPATPTFGAKLGRLQRVPNNINSPTSFVAAVFNTARHTLDFDFITRNPDYRNLVTYIDTGDANWLNFRMSMDDKLALFDAGMRAASDFLIRFDWERYKEIRYDLAMAHIHDRADDEGM